MVPPLRLERRSLAPEASALSTELWGQIEGFLHFIMISGNVCFHKCVSITTSIIINY